MSPENKRRRYLERLTLLIKFSATAFDIAKQINIVLNSDYKSPDGKGVWTSYGNMKCPDGHYTNPINWMEWYMGCSA